MWDLFISLMINILLYIYNLIGQNFGWAIIIFTILTRVVLYPLTARQMKSSKGMQELQESKKSLMAIQSVFSTRHKVY